MATRKRSRHVALVLAGSAVMALAACEDDRVDAQSFPDLASCVAAAQENSLWFTEADCRSNFANAAQEYLETAPRYESKELCEQEHGVGKCEGDPTQTAQNSGGGFSFMPMLMGFMLGSMMSRGGGVFSQPMVQTADGRYSTPKGDQSFASNRGRARFRPRPSPAARPRWGKRRSAAQPWRSAAVSASRRRRARVRAAAVWGADRMRPTGLQCPV
ncbi:DUF1190 domain-containing protein [Paracoccus sp. DMF-8]|uniref:DUF1190 domain-containing protein n=1 Tax=Paracoccus sp. DMF-8 TaxID=3019445 RepID=UPI0023E466F3|nr:DUF1190 domain-containing protein [Paracoccus sp. DMF-8]MDF3608408.1 DUF1190 domain-containing protein [Paracoccus sp. DMF-8]